jgi:hypothetical protein
MLHAVRVYGIEYDSEQHMAPISSNSPHIWSEVSLERANSLKAHTGGWSPTQFAFCYRVRACDLLERGGHGC